MMSLALSLLWPFPGILANCAYLYTVATVASLVYDKFKPAQFDAKGKHVFITGGSTGLGLATAIQLAKEGAIITIVSRSQANISKALETIRRHTKQAAGFTCDVTDQGLIKAAFDQAEHLHSQPVDVVICCAGLSTPGYFLECPVETHRKQMDLNYFGCLNVAKQATDRMVERGAPGHIVLVSSAAAFASFVGYSTYCPSKAALKALGECLRNELLPYNITVTMYYPSNMDTPGFKIENETKPAETKEIEGSVTLFKPEQAANNLITGLKRGRFSITDELLTELGRVSTSGTNPRSNTLVEMLILPLAAPIGKAFSFMTDYVVVKHAKQRRKTE